MQPLFRIDTADIDLVFPVKGAFDFTGSVLTATLTPIQGGPPAFSVSSADDQIDWFTDDAGQQYLRFTIPLEAFDGWTASRPTTLVFDIKRTAPPSPRIEWFDRASVLMGPGSDSAGIAQPAYQPVLVGRRPYSPILGDPIIPGPQGRPGSPGSARVVVSFPAASTVGGQRVVRTLGSTVAHASSDTLSHINTVLGVSRNAANTGGEVEVVSAGEIIEPTWSWAPGPVYLGLNGALTQTPPTSGYRQQVALATEPTKIVVNPQTPITLAS